MFRRTHSSKPWLGGSLIHYNYIGQRYHIFYPCPSGGKQQPPVLFGDTILFRTVDAATLPSHDKHGKHRRSVPASWLRALEHSQWTYGKKWWFVCVIYIYIYNYIYIIIYIYISVLSVLYLCYKHGGSSKPVNKNPRCGTLLAIRRNLEGTFFIRWSKLHTQRRHFRLCWRSTN